LAHVRSAGGRVAAGSDFALPRLPLAGGGWFNPGFVIRRAHNTFGETTMDHDRPDDRSHGLDRRLLLCATAAMGAGLVATAASSPGAAQAPPAPVWTPVPVPPQVPATEAVVDLPGTKIYYWDTGGTGRPVILLHAGTQSAAGWPYQQPVLAAAGYRVIAYSRRSYQGSDPGNQADPGIASEDLHNLINHLKLDKVDLVAAAQGGFFALDYVLSYPEKVRSLAIVASLMGITDADYVEVNTRLRPKFFATLPHDFQELSPSYRAGNPEGLKKWLELDHAAVPGTRITPRVKNQLTWARLESIRHPTLLLTGESDLYVPPALLRMQASHMPHAQVEVIGEAGHSPYWEQPVIFNDILLGFLARH
jgi:pimeloyl-ACP methyl ester carboxylesterase